MNIFKLLTLFMIFPSVLFSEENVPCKCSPYPFTPEPPCFNICASEFVRGYSKEEVLEVLSIAPGTERGVTSFQENPGFANTLHDILWPEHVADLKRAFAEADQEKLNAMLLELSTQ